MFYSISNWGNENVTQWAPGIAQSWQTSVDVHFGEQKGNTFYQIQANFLRNQMVRKAAGPGGWNDPDMLMIGSVYGITNE